MSKSYVMNNILVSGLINVETTVSVDEFPIEYKPIDYTFFGIESTVSGVGYNIAKALNSLGTKPRLLSIIGDDNYKSMILEEIKKDNISTDFILPLIKQTPQSVILYDEQGKRKIYLDLKEIQEINYPKDNLSAIFDGIDIMVLCNINFSRELLKLSKDAGKMIASDVHVISDLRDEYNKDFMLYADILFMSNEYILGKEIEFVKEVVKEYKNKIVVVGMGDKGALLYVKEEDKFTHFNAVKVRKIVSTIGAGDALFSAFLYFYSKNKDPYNALRNAVYFASYKIGEKGAASGFISEENLLELVHASKC